MQEKLVLWLTFNPGLALIGFSTTRPCYECLTGPWLNLYWKDSNLSFFHKKLLCYCLFNIFFLFPRVNLDAYNSLVEMGFSKHMAAASLRQANNDINDALQVKN